MLSFNSIMSINVLAHSCMYMCLCHRCNVCGMRFFQTGTLKTHMDRHTGRKRHLCELCGKAFRQGCQLRVHMRRHNKDMAFACQYCSKCFYTKSESLGQHIPVWSEPADMAVSAVNITLFTKLGSMYSLVVRVLDL